MNVKLGFSWIGTMVFVLPMLINIVYFIAQRNGDVQGNACPYKWVEIVEQVTRVLFAIAICFLLSNQKVEWKSPFLYVSLGFLVLYYIVWIRYFMGGMDVSLMSKSFLFIPIPLAVFPVYYYLFASLWLHNFIASAIILVFGIAHYAVSYLSFRG